MFPGMNPRQMKQAMKRMGIKQEEIDALQVVIRTADKEIVLSNPSVQKVNMMGQWSYQISGEETQRSISIEPDITQEDIQTVMEQTNVSEEKAKQALTKAKGDIAQAIIDLTGE